MPRVTVDGVTVELSAARTVLDAAARCGAHVPTLCHRPGLPHHTSCMVCVVKDLATGRLLPACSHPVHDGMAIDTTCAEVRRARREALELLLGDHVGDCRAPCRRVCPADLHVSRMIRHLLHGRPGAAFATARAALVLPGVLGRICPAPCEKGCRRGAVDEAVAIRRLHAYAAAAGGPPDPPPDAPAGALPPRAAVVGAGAAGLAAAWTLAEAGIACIVYDERPGPGGLLRDGVPRDRLPTEVLDADLARLRHPLITHEPGVRIGRDLAFDAVCEKYEAIVVACGRGGAADPDAFGLAPDAHGIRIDPATRAASRPRVFAAGLAVREHRMAVRSVADGRRAARGALALLGAAPAPRRFDSRMGPLLEGEADAFLPDAGAPAGSARPAEGVAFTPAVAAAEGGRCLHCDCRKAGSCRLRAEATRAGARQDAFRGGTRRRHTVLREHPDVVYEPAKCMLCGLCVRITKARGEPLGLAFVGRGFDTRVAVPLGRTLAEGLGGSAAACVEACPTAALSWRTWEEDTP